MSFSRRNFLQLSIPISAGIFIAPTFLSCSNNMKKGTKEMIDKLVYTFKPNEAYTIKMLTDSVGYFTERGGTIGFSIQPEGIAVVDTQFPEQSEHLVQALKETSEAPIKLLINTHHHGDHTSGNPVYKNLVEEIVAHENSKINQENSAKGSDRTPVLPTTTFTTNWNKAIGNESIKLHYFGAGHTNGDSFTHFENSNVVHTGDLVFNRRFPYIDKSAGANIENWIAVLDKANNTFDANTQFIFGHSDNGFPVEGNHEDIKAFKNYLEKLLAFGHQAIKDGKSLKSVKETTNEIPGAPEWQGNGIERSLDALWEEIN